MEKSDATVYAYGLPSAEHWKLKMCEKKLDLALKLDLLKAYIICELHGWNSIEYKRVMKILCWWDEVSKLSREKYRTDEVI